MQSVLIAELFGVRAEVLPRLRDWQQTANETMLAI
jgi:hypothetical protein